MRDKVLTKVLLVSLATLVSLLLLLGVYTVYTLNETDEGILETYYDKNINYTIKLPKYYSVDIPSEIGAKEIVNSSKKGLLFNVYGDKLREEIFSFVGVDDTDTSIKPFKRFILITFKGRTENPPNKQNDELEFVRLLSISGVEGVKITRESSSGKTIKATGIVEGKTIYFTHQKKEIGLNIMTITYGDISSRNKGDKQVESVFKSINFNIKEDNISEDFDDWLEDHYNFIEETRNKLK